MTMPAIHNQPPSHASSGARLVAVDGRELPLRAVDLAVEAAGGIARVTVTQRFRNPYDEPLCVRYELPLPADGAVSGFAFSLGGRRVVGEVDKKARARERFEEAVIAGHSAALLEQDRSSLFRQELGNVPPGEEIVAEITIDQKLRWLPEGTWEWRFPTVVAPRYLGAEGRVVDAKRVAVDAADGPLPVHCTLGLVVRDALGADARLESPSHAIVARERQGATSVAFAEERGARLDRDVVARWSVATPEVGAALVTARPASSSPVSSVGYGLLTLVPPLVEPEELAAPRRGKARTGHRAASAARLPRDLTLLIDASGSMGGEPLEQVRRAALALLATLDEGDSLEMIAFAWEPRRFRRGAERVTPEVRAAAEKWLRALSASGGTEMREGILEALRPLRAGAQRQVVLVTDGLIGFEEEIVRAIHERLPAGSRVHSVGVGSAVNRTLTTGAARAGRGVEAIIGLGEDAERAALRLVAHTALPAVVELELGGDALVALAPEKLPDLYAGAPALVSLALAPEGGELWVRGRTATGRFERQLRVAPMPFGSGAAGVVALHGRERVEDLEMRAATGERGTEREIESLGLRFQLATRMTSWIAVTAERTVDPREPVRRETMPQELPAGMSAEGLGLRATRSAVFPVQAQAASVLYSLKELASAGAEQGRAVMAPPPMQGPPLAGGPPAGYGAPGRLPSAAPLPAAAMPLGGPPPVGGSGRAGAPPAPGAFAPPAGAPPPATRATGAPPPPRSVPTPAPQERSLRRRAGPLAGKKEAAPADHFAGAARERQDADEPAASTEAKKGKRPLLGRLADGLKRAFGGGAPLRVSGRIVRRTTSQWVVEIELPSGVKWAPLSAVLVMADGSRHNLVLAEEATTRAGLPAAGASVRLAFAAPAGLGALAPVAVEVRCDGAEMIVDL